MQHHFHSRIDAKIVAMTVVLPLLLGGAFVTNGLVYGGAPWWSVLPLLLIGAFSLSLLISTWYEIETASLLVRCGPFAWRIPLEQIVAVRETSSLRSGPALSMDRLEVRYGDDRSILISPRDKQEFLQALRLQAPQLLERGAGSRHPT